MVNHETEGYKFLFCNMLSEALKNNRKSVGEFLKWFKDSDHISEYDKETIENSVVISGTAGYTHDLMIKGMLYDFFDEQKIYIGLTSSETCAWHGIAHRSYIHELGSSIKTNCQYHKTRQKAEVAVFTKAFEILDKRK